MKVAPLSVLLVAGTAIASPLVSRANGVQGFEISNHQSTVDYAGAYKAGARFVMIKATEGTSYIDPVFSSHYSGATKAGLIRGGYHFAHPGSSSGAAQAKYFLATVVDGLLMARLCPYNPSGATCYGLSASKMVAWVKEFGETYKSKTDRYPMIYTTADWWKTCTGGSTAFSKDYPLVLARYSSSVGTIPGGWPYQSIWQNSDSYKFGGDSDLWNGNEESLKRFAKGS